MEKKLKKKSKKPISRKFWDYMKFLPRPIQQKIVRAQFEIEETLPPELSFKQAETEAEIKAALRLVHDSYVELNYIDPNEARLRFSKFHALPTTVILVAKWEDEVIGTISIIPDSALGLPADETWPLDKWRQGGRLIAEISSLAIKKTFRMRRGKLLLPLCKFMYHYCSDILKLDAMVIATTVEVEPFYRDVLLFEPVVEKTGQEHGLVKGNPSTCCVLDLGENLIPRYKKVYDGKAFSRDLYKFFFFTDFSNMHYPYQQHCLQSYTLKKNASQAQILKTHSNLIGDISDHDKRVLKNLDALDTLPLDIDHDQLAFQRERKNPRLEVRFDAWAFFADDKRPMPSLLTNASKSGFQLVLKNNERTIEPGEHFVITFSSDESSLIHCRAKAVWVHGKDRIGCKIVSTSAEWDMLMDRMWQDLTAGPKVVNLDTKRRA